MSGYQNRLLDPFADSADTGTGIAPGKRTLTQSLAGQQRDVVDFDDAAGDDFYDSRATIDSPTITSSRLTDVQLRKAKRRNPHWQNKLGFSTSLFGGGAIDTGEFADNVADKQATLGLPVDGIAGPQTLQAIAAAQRPDALEATRGRRDPNGAAERATPAGIDRAGDGDFYDSRATIDTNPFAGDDPFGMHLISKR